MPLKREGAYFFMERVVLSKIESIERCVKRIDELYNLNEELEDKYMLEDAITLNIQRACQQAIDLAMYLCSKLALGLPKESRESFKIPNKAKLLSNEITVKMEKMVGFRNVAIHQYQDLERETVFYIADKGKEDFLIYSREVLEILKNITKN